MGRARRLARGRYGSAVVFLSGPLVSVPLPETRVLLDTPIIYLSRYSLAHCRVPLPSVARGAGVWGVSATPRSVDATFGLYRKEG